MGSRFPLTADSRRTCSAVRCETPLAAAWSAQAQHTLQLTLSIGRPARSLTGVPIEKAYSTPLQLALDWTGKRRKLLRLYYDDRIGSHLSTEEKAPLALALAVAAARRDSETARR
jgi:hypothetical protein